MKIFLAFVVTILFCFPAIAQNKTDREQVNLNGSVKTVEAYRIEFSLKDGKTEQAKRLPWYSNTFNPQGNLTERITYNHLGNIIEKIVYTFDAKGRSIGYDEYHTISDKIITLPRKHIYTLDDNGNKIEYRVFESNGTPASRFVYKYDLKGNKIEDSFYYHTGQFGGKTVYTFDDRGNQTSQTLYSADGIVSGKTIFTFDDKGNDTQAINYQGGILRYKFISKYDGKGRILEKETIEFNAIPNVTTSHAPIPGKVIFTYDDKKRTKEITTYKPDGALVESVIYTYDNQNNEIERVVFKEDGSPNNLVIQFYDNINEPGSKFRGSLSGKSLVEFEYDSHGNWTKKIHLIRSGKDAKPEAYYAEEQMITYYR